MRYTQQIVNQMRSAPSFEADEYAQIPEGDAGDESTLALESAEFVLATDGQLDEAGQLEDKIDRLTTLTDYVETQVNDQETTVTPNELALIEQTVDATLDGTGEEVDTVMPALESALGTSRVSLESVKDTTMNFLKAAKELVTGAASSFGNFIKGIFSRNAALKNRVEKLNKRLSAGEVQESAKLTAAQSVSAAWDENRVLDDFGKIIAGGADVAKRVYDLQNGYTQKLLSLHDRLVDNMDKVWGELNKRKDQEARIEVASDMKSIIVSLNDLNKATFKDGKEFGGFFCRFKPATVVDDFVVLSKNIVKSAPYFGQAGNVSGKDTDVKGITKERVGQLINSIKGTITNLQKIRKTDSMWAVDWISGMQTVSEIVLRAVINGVSFMTFMNSMNRTNRAFIVCYTRPLSAYVNHFYRVANAQLGLAEKAVKKAA